MKNIVATFILLCFVYASMSCSKMNDLHEKYLQGETIYAAKVDSVVVAPGNNRAQLEILILKQRIDKVTIYWDNNEKSKDLSIGNHTGLFTTVIDDLPEGEYLFNMISYDAFANKSLTFEFQVVTFGNLYRASLLNRRIERINIEDDEAVINWRAPLEGVKETKFSYTAVNGIVSEIIIPASDSRTVLSDFKPEGSYTFSTLYLPRENAIDTFESDITSGAFPSILPDTD